MLQIPILKLQRLQSRMIANKAIIALLIVPLISTFSLLSSADIGVIHEDEPIRPLPVIFELDEDKVKLGKLMYHDKRFSRNKSTSCASCHQLDSGGVDGQATSTLHDGGKYFVNTPTVFNSIYNFRYNWDGSVRTLEEQINYSVLSNYKGNNTWEELIATLSKDQKLVRQFKQVYKRGLTKSNYIDALAEFVKSLTTPNSKFDRYLRGDQDAISKNEKQGYKLFKDFGCISCHQGMNVGGNLFQELGIFYDYFAARGNIKPADYGRMNATNRKQDKHVFKVPSLRNVELTAPYLHDGQAKTLEETVIIMGETELGRTIKRHEVKRIVQFMKTLTGEYKEYGEYANN